jgi:hypothetical protein
MKLGALVLLGAVAVAAASARADAAGVCDDTARFVDFIHVEANEGGSSGGHVALRLGGSVYHWQHEDGGLLRLSRRDRKDFLYEYSVLENRTLHVSRIAVSEAGFAELRDAFQRRWLDEVVAEDGLGERRSDRALLEGLLAARSPGVRDASPSLRVAGAGFFSPSGELAAVDPAVARLRDRIARERGATFLAARARGLREELAARLPAWIEEAGEGEPRAEGAAWTPSSGLAREVEERVAGAFAVDVIASARSPAPAALRAPPDGDDPLDDRERVALARWSERLESDLARRVASDRPGWAAALLVGLARLSALDRSLADGRLVVVDAYPDAPSRVAGSRLERHRALLPEVLDEARRELLDARERFASSPPTERTWADVETAANRVRELERVVAGGGELRLAPAPMLPSRSAALPFEPPNVEGSTLRDAHAASIRREKAWSERQERQFGYHLLTRNCATEVFRVVGGALGEPIAVEGSLDFIPFLSARAVRERWRVVAEREIPSLRRRRAESGDAWDALREASPFTSNLRAAARRDSIFLWFTDDLPWLRPALGTANLATGVGAAVAGVVIAPFDDAEMLVAGLRGVLFSLPELAFVSIRKGAYEWIPPADRPEPDALDASPSALACDAPSGEGGERTAASLEDDAEEALDDESVAAVAIAPAG